MRLLILFAGLYFSAVNGHCEALHIPCEGLNRNLSGQGPKMTVVDVRTAADYVRSHIPGAINVSYDAIGKAKLPKNSAIALYGNSNQCPWSKLAAKTLEDAGYKNVWVLDGGIAEWTAEKFALQTPAGITQSDGQLNVGRISPERLRKQMEKGGAAILDTRAAADFAIGHIPGAKNIPADAIGAALSALSKDTEWTICDKDPAKAKDVVRLMSEKGFKAVELSGGVQVWAAKKYPLETGQAR